MSDEQKDAVYETMCWLQSQAHDDLLLGWLTAKKYQLKEADWFIPTIKLRPTIIPTDEIVTEMIERIKVYNNMSDAELADYIGVSRPTLYKIKSKPSYITLESFNRLLRLAKEKGVDLVPEEPEL